MGSIGEPFGFDLCIDPFKQILVQRNTCFNLSCQLYPTLPKNTAKYICLTTLHSYCGVFRGMTELKADLLQNQGMCIEANMNERITRSPIIAAIYARATHLDKKFNISVQTKVRNCWNYCNERGWRVEYIFVDRLEGRDKTRKLNFERMSRKVKSGNFDVIVFCNFDKFDSPISSVSGESVNRRDDQNYDLQSFQ